MLISLQTSLGRLTLFIRTHMQFEWPKKTAGISQNKACSMVCRMLARTQCTTCAESSTAQKWLLLWNCTFNTRPSHRGHSCQDLHDKTFMTRLCQGHVLKNRRLLNKQQRGLVTTLLLHCSCKDTCNASRNKKKNADDSKLSSNLSCKSET